MDELTLPDPWCRTEVCPEMAVPSASISIFAPDAFFTYQSLVASPSPRDVVIKFWVAPDVRI
jgi:hypothetical protein